MYNVLIYGAGSIGNHLSNACRNKGWDVVICDPDSKALERTKNDIYPVRYGKWDNTITLVSPDKLPNDKYDIVMAGTPPDTHLKIALEVIEKIAPKVLLIEKPLCTPSLERCDLLLKSALEKGVQVLVGYNHAVTENTKFAEEVLANNFLGNALSLNVSWLEYWGGIFSAHPWLSGPKDTYLGYYKRGGGACGEHSHAINICQHFSRLLGKGRIIEVSCMMDIVQDKEVCYDRFSSINYKTESGLFGTIIQDVITEPSEKSIRIQGDKGYLEWWVNYEKDNDAVIYSDSSNKKEIKRIAKKRPDDFKGEINHIEDILSGKTKVSPISLERGLETSLVIAASYLSNQKKSPIAIKYENGYNLKSLEIIK
jgi:predicted dehydrogenase